MRAHRPGRRLLRLAQTLSQRGFLYRADLSVHGLSGDHVPRAVRDSAHQRVDRAVGGDAARSRAENRAAATGLLGLRLAALRAARYEKLGLSSTGFSLWGFDLARTKPHRLKPVLLKPIPRSTSSSADICRWIS